MVDVEGGDRQRPERAGGEQFAEFTEHLGDQIGAGVDHVEGLVLHPGVGGGDLGWLADVGLAHLQEVAAVRQQA
nr:hypothetical protein [Plantactinospora sp. KBS50]